MVQPDRPQMTNRIRCMRFACWAAKNPKALRTYNAYCFSTASVVTRAPPYYNYTYTALLVISFINAKIFLCKDPTVNILGREICHTSDVVLVLL